MHGRVQFAHALEYGGVRRAAEVLDFRGQVGRLARVSLAVVLVCALAPQQLQVKPFPAAVGQEVVVRAHRDGAPLADVRIEVELPGGSTASTGATDARGELRFRPEQAGYHVFAAAIDGVRTLAPLSVVAARDRWPLALGAVPLGLALLWWNLSRARGRRDP